MNLAELITDRKGTRSYDRLARDCGGRPTAARLQQIATMPLASFPDPETLTNLAKGLKVSLRAVVAAAAESIGLDLGTAPGRLIEWLPAERLGDLTSEDIDAVLAVVNAMLAPPPARSHLVEGGALLFVPDAPQADRDLRTLEQARATLTAALGEQQGPGERAVLMLSRHIADSTDTTKAHDLQALPSTPERDRNRLTLLASVHPTTTVGELLVIAEATGTEWALAARHGTLDNQDSAAGEESQAPPDHGV